MTWLAEIAAQMDVSQEAAALYFLGGGGMVSPRDWLELDAAGQAALVAAGKRRDVLQAVRIGRCRNQLGEAVVLQEIDGGETLDYMRVSSLIDQVEAALVHTDCTGGAHGVR